MATSDVAFSPMVKAVQSERGSRQAYQRQEARGGFEREVAGDLAGFLTTIDTAYLATASADGQPYVQHRGGAKGFIRALGGATIGFLDRAGNRQYVTTGNLRENDRVCLFLMDYEHRQRVKVWGRARVVSLDDPRAQALLVGDDTGRAEQAILIEVSAWDANCPKYIPQKVDAAEAAAVITELRARVAALEAENRKLRR